MGLNAAVHEPMEHMDGKLHVQFTWNTLSSLFLGDHDDLDALADGHDEKYITEKHPRPSDVSVGFTQLFDPRAGPG